MIAIERYLNAKVLLDAIYYEKTTLASLDNKTQFLKLNLSELQEIEKYKLFVYFILPFPLQNIITEEVNDLQSEVVVEIPKTATMVPGELKIELAFYDKQTCKYLTIPTRIKIPIVETVNNEDINSFVPGESVLNTITEAIEQLDQICNQKIQETETELTLIAEKLKNQLLEYKSSLETELKNFQISYTDEIIKNINIFLNECKTDLIKYIDAQKQELNNCTIENKNSLLLLINEQKELIEKVISNYKNELSDIKNASVNNIIKISDNSILKIKETTQDAINRIGESDNAMYNQYTPSVRKAAIDSIKNQKYDIIHSAKQEILEEMREHITNLKEQRFMIEIDPYITQITLPGSFTVSDITKVFSNGHLLAYRRDYRWELGAKNIIRLLHALPHKRVIIVTETLAVEKLPDFHEATWENIPYTTVVRDENGSFSANIIHANLDGNSLTTDKLKKPVKINGISFDGSKDIEIEYTPNIATEEEIIEIFKKTNKGENK